MQVIRVFLSFVKQSTPGDLVDILGEGLMDVNIRQGSAAIPAVRQDSMSKRLRFDAIRKPLKAMDGFRERQDGFMCVCE